MDTEDANWRQGIEERLDALEARFIDHSLPHAPTKSCSGTDPDDPETGRAYCVPQHEAWHAANG